MPVTISECKKCGELPTIYPVDADMGFANYWVAECKCGTVEENTLYHLLHSWSEMDWSTYQCEPDCHWCKDFDVEACT